MRDETHFMEVPKIPERKHYLVIGVPVSMLQTISSERTEKSLLLVIMKYGLRSRYSGTVYKVTP